MKDHDLLFYCRLFFNRCGHYRSTKILALSILFSMTMILIYNYTFLATTVSFPAILVPKTVSTFRFCLQHQLIGRLLGSQKILNRGIISQNQSFPSMSKDVLDLYILLQSFALKCVKFSYYLESNPNLKFLIKQYILYSV